MGFPRFRKTTLSDVRGIKGHKIRYDLFDSLVLETWSILDIESGGLEHWGRILREAMGDLTIPELSQS